MKNEPNLVQYFVNNWICVCEEGEGGGGGGGGGDK